MILKNKKRRLSVPRFLLVLAILVAGVFGLRTYGADMAAELAPGKKEASDRKPWFASYVDATLTPQYQFEQYEDNVVLSFVVAKSNTKEASWGNAYSLKQASEDLDLDRRIARLRQNGKDVIVSFGGLLNDELALVYDNADDLAAAYQQVIDAYQLSTIDLDLENDGLTDCEAGKRRAEAIAKLQKDNKNQLAVWLTLPVIPQGLTKDGTDTVAEMLAAGVDLAGVNLMTMNFGQARDDKKSMAENAIDALKQTHRQLKILYREADIHLSDGAVWQKLGATPMIGQNDISQELFTLEDAAVLNEFAVEVGLGRVSMWSANRDLSSNKNNVNTGVVSNHASGVKQDGQAFAAALREGMDGDIAASAKGKTVSDVKEGESDAADDPKTSPYEIWQETKSYLKDTKVVWRHNVYRAKWWTKGDAPDSPVLQESEIPWELVGPVLEGEKPVKLATLPPGTYPEWNPEEVYDSGKRIMYNGIAYESKWWNQNENPERSGVDDDLIPWRALSQQEIKKILKQK